MDEHHTSHYGGSVTASLLGLEADPSDCALVYVYPVTLFSVVDMDVVVAYAQLECFEEGTNSAEDYELFPVVRAHRMARARLRQLLNSRIIAVLVNDGPLLVLLVECTQVVEDVAGEPSKQPYISAD